MTDNDTFLGEPIDSGGGRLTSDERFRLGLLLDELEQRGTVWRSGRTCAYLAVIAVLGQQGVERPETNRPVGKR